MTATATATAAALTTTRVRDALAGADKPLTSSGLARLIDARIGDVKPALSALGSDVASALRKSASGRSVRVYRLSDRARIRQAARIELLAQGGSEPALRGSTRQELRTMVRCLGGSCRQKEHHAVLVGIILKLRAALFPACPCGEPVEQAGRRCEPCIIAAEAVTPAAAAVTPIRVRAGVRKPDVVLGLDEAELAVAAEVVGAQVSARAKQRALACFLARRNEDGFISAEVLRTLLRLHRALNKANFTVNMRKDGFEQVRDGGKLRGWK